MDTTERWLHNSLSELLDFPVPNDLTQYILQIHNDRDLDDYLGTLLDFDNRKHKNFIAELKRKRASDNQLSGYKKVNDNENPTSQKSWEKKKSKPKEKEKEKEKDNTVTVCQETTKHDKTGKKKTKFTNFYSSDMQPLLFKNRQKCDCEAKTHSLINNCLNCGRIVCAQEGPGPCHFCGNLVCTPDQQSILSMNTKQSDHLYNKLMEQKPSQAQEAALLQRDKLLEFDRNSAKRTQVIDDQSDYYQSSNSVWLSEQERQKIQKWEEEIRNQKYGSRLSKKVSIDIYGRQVIEENEEIPEFHPSQSTFTVDNNYDQTDLVCPSIQSNRPQYVETRILENSSLKNMNKHEMSTIWRIQDKELHVMVDEGLCLSLHQPYASLLVKGIKIHEGRNWYSAHRGRLWIHAAAKIPSTEDISTLEHRYKILIGDHIKFPENYPTGCLLGCVTVVDVLPQVEYKKQFPNGDSDSPYVFICEDFRELKLKFPMQGHHKIYKLDKQIHQAAIKCIGIV